jgi:putative oxidoreductase
MIRRLPGPAQDVALLVARLVLGVVLIAHGWQKLVTNGIDATITGFGRMGIPAAPASAVFATAVELLGGVLLVAGAATALVGVLVALNMLGAALLVHIGEGVFVRDGGWELVGVIGAAALALAAAGAGRLSIDHIVSGRRRGAPVSAD